MPYHKNKTSIVLLVGVNEYDLDREKLVAARKFFRRGQNRRWDHGTRGNCQPKGHNRQFGGDWFYDADDPLMYRRRKDSRRGAGVGNKSNRIKTRVQREGVKVEFEEALLEAGLIFWLNFAIVVCET